MKDIPTVGLVLRQINYAEADRILTVYTEQMGIVQVMAKGARKLKSHFGGVTQFLGYGKFLLHSGRTLYSLRGATGLGVSFISVGNDIQKLALATYLCDVAAAFVPEEVPEPEPLRLLLAALHILAHKDRPTQLIKTAFELRLLALAGFGVCADCCADCGSGTNLIYLSAAAGGVLCETCGAGQVDPAGPGLRNALSYILTQPLNRIFSFTATPDLANALASFAEQCVRIHAEKEFASLRYYNSVIIS